MKRSKQVGLVDYGIGNLFSVGQALNAAGAQVTTITDPASLKNFDYIVLPGVGAFGAGRELLRKQGMDQSLQEFARSGRPLLGICLGMQLLFDESEEFGKHPGLGLIPGSVVKIPTHDDKGASHKIPHIGWNSLLSPSPTRSWQKTILEGVPSELSVYFVHSFHAVPSEKNEIVAVCKYYEQMLTAVVQREQVVGCQFHPEKSGEVGLMILRRWLS